VSIAAKALAHGKVLRNTPHSKCEDPEGHFQEAGLYLLGTENLLEILCVGETSKQDSF
jgi:hypothetical protein